MDSNLLIDLSESPNLPEKDSINELIGPLDSSVNVVSPDGVENSTVSNNGQASSLLGEVRGKHINDEGRVSPFGCPVMKAQSMDSLSANDFNGLSMLPQLGNKMAARRPQSVNLEQFAGEASSLLSPFSSPRPQSTPSLHAESLLDTETTKLMSPFGWTPTCIDPVIINEVNQVDVPIGNLIQVQEPEPTLPDDLFDVDTLGRKQLQHSKSQQSVKYCPPVVQVLLPSLGSNGSEGMSTDGTLNKGFMESVSDESSLFPTPDDSVFEEAQGLSKVLQGMATEGSRLTLESIEDEDGSILFECPDWKEEHMDCDLKEPIHVDVQKTLEMYARGRIIEKGGGGGLVSSKGTRKSSSAFSNIAVASSESEYDSSSFSSSISAISPTPLSSERVENMKLKAGSLIGNQFDVGSLKLRASSCSSMPSSKSGPLKAFVPLEKVMKNRASISDTRSIYKKPFDAGTPHLQVMNSPDEGFSVNRRMSSTPKPHTPDTTNSNKNKPNNGSSLKKPVRNKIDISEQANNSGTKKCTGTSVAPSRSLSLGKLKEHQKFGGNNVTSAKTSGVQPTSLLKKFHTGSLEAEPGNNKRNPSPLLQRKIANSSSVMKTPTRSISTGSLSSSSSMKKMNRTPQVPSLQDHERSNSIPSKLPQSYTGRPLAEASINSPAKHSSPLLKFVSKFRRNPGPKVMKENMHPV